MGHFTDIIGFLNTNSGAITALATCGGVLVALWYTWVTRRLARIANQQHQLQSAQVQHMLYKPRMKVFDGVTYFIAHVLLNRWVDIETAAKLHEDTKTSIYIFKEDVQRYLEEFNKNATKLFIAGRQYEALEERCDQDEERVSCKKEMDELCEWFDGQEPIVKEKFMPYLKIHT